MYKTKNKKIGFCEPCIGVEELKEGVHMGITFAYECQTKDESDYYSVLYLSHPFHRYLLEFGVQIICCV